MVEIDIAASVIYSFTKDSIILIDLMKISSNSRLE